MNESCNTVTPHFWLNSLPEQDKLCKNSVYFIKESNNTVTMYVTSSVPEAFLIGSIPVSDISIISPNNTIQIVKEGQVFKIDISTSLLESIKSAQNNIVKVVDTYYTSLTNTLQDVVNNVNSDLEIVIKEDEIYIIKAYPAFTLPIEGYIPPINKYIIKNIGKSLPGENYGLNGVPLTIDNLELIYTSVGVADDVISVNTQFIDIIDLGNLSISDYVNQYDPYYEIQNQEEGTVIFNVGTEPNIQQYWFVAQGGEYGLYGDQTSDEDFILLSQDSQSVLNPVSATQIGIVNNTPLQELGGVDKLINGVRIGRGKNNLAYNYVFGDLALNSITTGNLNTAIGGFTLSLATTGSYNTGVGVSSLYNSTTGINNTAIGSGALSGSVGATNGANSRNTAIGANAGNSLITGNDNVLIGGDISTGVSSGLKNGSNNTIIGRLNNNLATGSNNTIIGRYLSGVTTLNDSIIIATGTGVIGLQKLSDNTLLAPTQTNTLITADATGKAIVTKEWLASNQNFVPLPGTLPGAPITGNLAVTNFFELYHQINDSTRSFLRINNSGVGIGIIDTFGSEGVITVLNDRVTLNGANNSGYRGLIGNQLFPKLNDPNAYAQIGDLQNGYIPLPGTLPGLPITGDLEFEYDTDRNIRSNNEDYTISSNIMFGSGYLQLGAGRSVGSIGNSGLTLNDNGNVGSILVESSAKGMVGTALFNKDNDPNAYVQLGDIEKSNIYANVLDYGVVCDSSTDNRIALQTLFDSLASIGKSIVYFPPNADFNYIVSDYVNIPSNVTVTGIRGGSVIELLSGGLQLFQLISNENVTIENITIKGYYPDVTLTGSIPMPAAGIVDNFNDAVNKTNISSGTGIGIQGGEKINIIGCEITNFGHHGILIHQSGRTFEYGVKITDNYVHDNYVGLETNIEGEYSSFIGNSFTRNQIGVYNASGNNLYTNNHLDKNRVGLVLQAGFNDSHGTFSSCTFNHNALYGVLANSITAGESFTGCQFWYGDIYLKDCKGINITGSIIGSSIVYLDGTGTAQNSIANNAFSNGSFFMGAIPNTVRFGNFFINGTDSSSLNDELFVPARGDYERPDMFTSLAGIAIKSDTKSYIVFKKADGTNVFFNGTTNSGLGDTDDNGLTYIYGNKVYKIYTNDFERFRFGATNFSYAPLEISSNNGQPNGAVRNSDLTPYAKKIDSSDIEVTDFNKGVILKSPDGTRWRITVSNVGVLTTTSI